MFEEKKGEKKKTLMEKYNKIQKTYIICNNKNPKIYQYYITSRYHSKIPLDPVQCIT